MLSVENGTSEVVVVAETPDVVGMTVSGPVALGLAGRKAGIVGVGRFFPEQASSNTGLIITGQRAEGFWQGILTARQVLGRRYNSWSGAGSHCTIHTILQTGFDRSCAIAQGIRAGAALCSEIFFEKPDVAGS